jgi:hypothetical protein
VCYNNSGIRLIEATPEEMPSSAEGRAPIPKSSPSICAANWTTICDMINYMGLM